jgi:hypothetical protein
VCVCNHKETVCIRYPIMFRRVPIRLSAVVAAAETKTPTSYPRNNHLADGAPQQTAASSSKKTSEFKLDPRPSASEAPHILATETERKPFVSAKNTKEFVGSFVVGVSLIGTFYFLLSKSLASSHAEEAELLALATRNVGASAPPSEPQPVLPEFVAPSSFAGLKRKMALKEKLEEERMAQERSLHGKSPVIHQELTMRAKQRWNAMLEDLQSSCAVLSLQYRQYREQQVKASVMDGLEMKGWIVETLTEKN